MKKLLITSMLILSLGALVGCDEMPTTVEESKPTVKEDVKEEVKEPVKEEPKIDQFKLDLDSLLTSIDSSGYADFSKKYFGKEIIFDGVIDSVALLEGKNTRYSILLSYDGPNHTGPAFIIDDVGISSSSVRDLFKSGLMKPGQKVKVTANVSVYSAKSDTFGLSPTLIEAR